MGTEIEHIAAEILEGYRKRARPRISQEKIGEFLWPRKIDPKSGRERGDPKTQWSILLRPSANDARRRLKLGEFLEACEFLDLDPVYVFVEAMKKLKERSEHVPAREVRSAERDEAGMPKKEKTGRTGHQSATATGQ